MDFIKHLSLKCQLDFPFFKNLKSLFVVLKSKLTNPETNAINA